MSHVGKIKSDECKALMAGIPFTEETANCLLLLVLQNRLPATKCFVIKALKSQPKIRIVRLIYDC